MLISVLQSNGVDILGYLTTEELQEIKKVSLFFNEVVDSILMWRVLFSSISGALKGYNPSPQAAKDVRVRTIKSRPESSTKPKPKSISIREEKCPKQWFFIPPDLEEKLKLITINRASVVRKDPNFSGRCFEVLETWASLLVSTLKEIKEKEIRGEDTDPKSIILYWKDKSKILSEIMEELNDICIAKLDSIFVDTPSHKKFISAINKLKKEYEEAREMWKYAAKIEVNLVKVVDVKTAYKFGKSLIESLEKAKESCKYFNEKRILDIIGSICYQFFQILEKQIDFNELFKSEREISLKKIKQAKLFSTWIIDSKLLNSSSSHLVRPSTSYATEKNQPRPTTPSLGAGVIKSQNFLTSNLLYLVTVLNDLHSMVSSFSQIKEIENPSKKTVEFITLYEKIPIEFSIWSSENSILWARLVHAFKDGLNKLQKTPLVKNHESSGESEEDLDESIVAPSWNVR
ncbi:unnamed protein product [Blepharisma stoltei]|uniref:Dynein heavy chain tail domain-containing protein n=1 Tax=Blepharisma stoltei TaxID=1481888 RepID=A0AAU9JKE4_9CILI|nr:unnamed protein product [Blepharisma stoltei]